MIMNSINMLSTKHNN